VPVRVEREVEGSGASGQAITEVVVGKYEVPILGYCQDEQARRCKDVLVSGMKETLVGLPTLPKFVNNVTNCFNC